MKCWRCGSSIHPLPIMFAGTDRTWGTRNGIGQRFPVSGKQNSNLRRKNNLISLTHRTSYQHFPVHHKYSNLAFDIGTRYPVDRYVGHVGVKNSIFGRKDSPESNLGSQKDRSAKSEGHFKKYQFRHGKCPQCGARLVYK